MPNKLKDLTITSVDLVEAGANQKANIQIVKGKDNEMPQNTETSVDLNQLAKSIADLVSSQIDELLKSNSDNSEVIENTQENSEVIPEESEVIEETSEVTEDDVAKAANAEEVKKLIELNLASIRKENSEIRKQNDELKKSLELVQYEQIAKKYEAIGENPKELANKLYKYKQAGDDFYTDYISILDKSLSVQNETGVFKEFGTSKTNDNGSQIDTVIKSYIEKGLTEFEAYEKAALDHPELLREYDESYRG